MSEQGPSEWPSYASPPILEASFIIKIRPISTERFALLGRVGEMLGSKFPRAELLTDSKPKYLEVPSTVYGMVYTSEDESESVQARSDGFYFSRQAPYEGWRKFLEHARSAWGAYKEALSSLAIVEVQVRYVNSIPFPLGVPLHELFNTHPTYPDPSQLFDALTMFYRVTIQTEPRTELSVLMTNLPRGERYGYIMLDNTVSMTVTSESEVWEQIPTLRNIKNSVFESQLKPILKDQFGRTLKEETHE